MQTRKIPATIVTGFLGAGKTTLLRHLLANAQGKRIAVIVNEFGELGIDGELLRSCGIGCDENGVENGQLFELANGCLCCTVQEEFAPVMELLAARRDQIDHLGVLVLHGVDHARHLLEMVGQLVLDLVRLARAPRKGPWRDVSGHLYRMGATALPITALVGFLIGVVLAYLMSLQLRQFGAESFIVNILGISLIRELGPMLAAILVAGRSGSAITAQIGVMRVTEELDAMRVMGIPHGFRLVMPRTLALALAMPLISVWTTLAALAGGMLAADVAMDISPGYFVQALPAAVKIGNLGLAMAKSVVFGAFIALIGCHWGLRVKPNTQSLGEGTTASVVSSITMVIIVDALFAVAFKNIGI